MVVLVVRLGVGVGEGQSGELLMLSVSHALALSSSAPGGAWTEMRCQPQPRCNIPSGTTLISPDSPHPQTLLCPLLHPQRAGTVLHEGMTPCPHPIPQVYASSQHQTHSPHAGLE